MTDNDVIDGLFVILLQHDISWQFIYSHACSVILSNGSGVEIHADTLEVALRTALSLYGGN